MSKRLTGYQAHMRRALKGKMKGKTKAQRKALFKAAAKSWKGKGKSKPKSRSKPKSNPKPKTGGNRTVAKGGLNQSKIFKLVRLAALAMPAATKLLDTRVSVPGRVRNVGKAYFGFDNATGQFNWEWAKEGWSPFVFASVVTYGIPKLVSFIKGLV